jgi:hypothetical protein
VGSALFSTVTIFSWNVKFAKIIEAIHHLPIPKTLIELTQIRASTPEKEVDHQNHPHQKVLNANFAVQFLKANTKINVPIV